MKKRFITGLMVCSLVLNIVFIKGFLSAEQRKPNPEITYYNTLDYLKGARESYSASLESKGVGETEKLLIYSKFKNAGGLI